MNINQRQQSLQPKQMPNSTQGVGQKTMVSKPAPVPQPFTGVTPFPAMQMQQQIREQMPQMPPMPVMPQMPPVVDNQRIPMRPTWEQRPTWQSVYQPIMDRIKGYGQEKSKYYPKISL